MSDDSFSEITSESWFGRIKSAFGGVVIGLLLIVGSVMLLFWNEGRTIKRQRALKEGAGAVQSISADKIDPSLNGRLVHITAKADTSEELSDPKFGVNQTAIKLKRQVEMYQWQEKQDSKTKKKLGGGTETETTYSYSKLWSNRLIDSASFKKQANHENPASMPWESKEQSASQVTAGSFSLSAGLIAKITNYQPLKPPEEAVDAINNSGRIATLQGEQIYVGYNSDSPEIGDLRISFKVVRPSTVSIVASQQENELHPYITSNDQEIELLQVGSHTAQAMFKKAEQDNQFMKWLLRALGLFLMFVGFNMLFKPLSVLADVIPILGDIAEFGLGLVSGLLTICLGFLTIAIAWFFYRPLLAIVLIIIALLPIYFLIVKRSKKAAAAA